MIIDVDIIPYLLSRSRIGLAIASVSAVNETFAKAKF
jgi:hypothetical protein